VSAVQVVQLRKEFSRRRRPAVVALHEISFTVARGECVAVLGQNGSGKSTLVRLLSTLLLPDGGFARVFGHDVVREERAVRAVVNRVSVEASFFKRMSAAENLSYAARFYGLGHGHTRRRIPEILERSASRLSGRRRRWRTSRVACSRRSPSPARC
jgi:ABC-2 type transport system ATP-binding protein